MSARLVQIFLPDEQVELLETVLPRHTKRFWRESVPGDQEKYSCIVQQRYTERLLVDLDAAFGSIPSFAAHVTQLEAVLPVVAETPQTELNLSSDLPPPTRIERFFSRDRLSTDELYDDIEESLHVRPSFMLTVVLSAIIAGLGMRSGQTAVVIGAMIIAPLLGPTMGLALAATVGNGKLARQAAGTLSIGCILAVLSGLAVGVLVTIDPLIPELRNRTIIQPADIALALACGAAGVLAFSRGGIAGAGGRDDRGRACPAADCCRYLCGCRFSNRGRGRDAVVHCQSGLRQHCGYRDVPDPGATAQKLADDHGRSVRLAAAAPPHVHDGRTDFFRTGQLAMADGLFRLTRSNGGDGPGIGLAKAHEV